MSDNYEQDDLTAGARDILSKTGKTTFKYLAKKGLLKKLLIPVVVFLLIITVLFGTGIVAVFSAASLFEDIKEFFMGEDVSVDLYGQASDILALLERGYEPDDETLKAMRLNHDTFRYLLTLADSYNEYSHSTREITIEGERHYIQKVTVPDISGETDSPTSEGSSQTTQDSVSATDNPTITISVSNENTEDMLFMDWRRLYFYSLFASLENEQDDTISTITKGNIDAAYNAIAMRYDYAFDVMNDTKDSYSYEECKSLPHVKSVSGDPDTEAGETTYYYPVSLMNYAYSGHSRLVYTLDDSGNIRGIEEHFMPERYESIGRSLSKFYSTNLFDVYCSLFPGGDTVKEQFDYYQYSYEHGDPVIYRSDFTHSLGDYDLSAESHSLDTLLPDNGGTILFPMTGLMPGNNGLVFDGEVLYKYPQTVGEAAVNLALSRLNWSYSQDRRMQVGYWDCSSMISRVYSELGVAIPSSSTTLELQEIAKDRGQIIDQSEMIAGDVLWFSSSDGSERHVVMYAGNGQCVHAKGKNYGTVYEPLDTVLRSTRKTLRFCFRPYHNVNCTWNPPEINIFNSSLDLSLMEEYNVSMDNSYP